MIKQIKSAETYRCCHGASTCFTTDCALITCIRSTVDGSLQECWRIVTGAPQWVSLYLKPEYFASTEVHQTRIWHKLETGTVAASRALWISHRHSMLIKRVVSPEARNAELHVRICMCKLSTRLCILWLRDQSELSHVVTSQSEGLLIQARSSVRSRQKLRTQVYIDLRYIDPQSKVLDHCFK